LGLNGVREGRKERLCGCVFVSEQVRIREDGCFGGRGRGRSF